MCSFDVCVRLCVRSGPVNQTSLNWELNANSFKTVKPTDFKFDVLVPRDNPKILRKGAAVKIHLAEMCTLTSAF